MTLPEVFGDNFDDWFDDPWSRWFNIPTTSKSSTHRMSTDVKETADSYQMEMELPGFKKEDIQAELKDGYLTITAAHNGNNDEKNEEGKYIRRERYTGSFSRTFYIGENIEPEDIHAKFEDGILKLQIPKNVQPKVEEKKTISID